MARCSVSPFPPDRTTDGVRRAAPLNLCGFRSSHVVEDERQRAGEIVPGALRGTRAARLAVEGVLSARSGSIRSGWARPRLVVSGGPTPLAPYLSLRLVPPSEGCRPATRGARWRRVAMDATRRKSIGNLYRLESRRLARLSARTADAPAQPLSREHALESLSAREVAVLQLVADGFANREIGACLSITEETVKSHVRRLLAKLHADNRAHAVSIAFRRGLIG